MDELKENAKFNTIRTLKCIASKEEQIKYKNAVPFVHIGYELLAQSNEISRLLDTNWFRDIWTDDQVESLVYFRKLYLETTVEFSTNMPDVPKLFENLNWLNFMDKAKSILLFLQAD